MNTTRTFGTAMAAVLALLLWVGTAQGAILADFKAGAEPDGFRGVKWGTAFSDFSSMEETLGGSILGREVAHYTKTGDDLRVGSLGASDIFYMFTEGKFRGVTVEFSKMKDAQWNTLAKALFDQYGEVEELVLTGDPTYVWFGDKTFIRLSRSNDAFWLDIWSRYLMSASDTPRDKFQRAVSLSDLPRIKEMIEADPSLAKTVDEDDGQTPLHWSIECHAAKLGEQTLELLISKGADVNAKAKDGTTPLYRAAKLDMIGLVKFLISKGADVNARNNKGVTPLKYAIDKELSKIIELLRQHGGTE